MNRHYFDYAASTPVDPAVIRAMAPFWADKFGNPGSLHSFGQELRPYSGAGHDRQISWLSLLGNSFTGSATEANNLIMQGVLRGIMNNESELRMEKIHNP